MTQETPPTDPDDVVPEIDPNAKSGADIYNTVTDKIGGPSIRAFDNLFSIGGGVVGGIVGVVIFHLMSSPGERSNFMYIGSFVLGVLGGVIVAGIVLMVIGLVRR